MTMATDEPYFVRFHAMVTYLNNVMVQLISKLYTINLLLFQMLHIGFKRKMFLITFLQPYTNNFA